MPEQTGFRPGKYFTAQVLNLTQHIEDGFETGTITGIVLVDISAAYDIVDHPRLLEKVYKMTFKRLPPDVHDSHSTGEPSYLRGTQRENK